MEQVMFQFRWATNEEPSIDAICSRFGFRPSEIDASFGVIETDPAERLFTILVDVRAQSRIEPHLKKTPTDPSEGFFANPKIEPFGTPKP